MATILGRSFDSPKSHEASTLIERIPRFTYRKNFAPLSNKSTTDRPWGCCIRTGQSLLAQYLIHYSQTHPQSFERHFSSSDPLSLFWDVPDAPFGIHAFCRTITELGGKPGRFARPSLICLSISSLLKPHGIPVLIPEDGLLSNDSIGEHMKDDAPLLLLKPTMLGVAKLDSEYDRFVKSALGLKQTLGIVGGVRRKSFFFVGYSATDLLYFDPHSTVKAVRSAPEHRRLYRQPLKAFRFRKVESSMLVGFCIHGMEDFQEVLQAVANGGRGCPLAIVDGASRRDSTVEDDWDIVGTV